LFKRTLTFHVNGIMKVAEALFLNRQMARMSVVALNNLKARVEQGNLD